MITHTLCVRSVIKNYRRLKFSGGLDEEDFQNGGLPGNR